MVSTRRVVSLLTPEEKIAHLALDHDRDLLAWVEGEPFGSSWATE